MEGDEDFPYLCLPRCCFTLTDLSTVYPKAYINWYFTYHRYQKKKLKIHPSTYDPCFLYTQNILVITKRKESLPRGFVRLQTVDTAYFGDSSFIKMKAQTKKSFDSKDTTIIKDDGQLKFNGGTVKLRGDTYSIPQPDHVEKLKKLDENSFTKDHFFAKRAQGSYIAVVCRPESSFHFCAASQITKP